MVERTLCNPEWMVPSPPIHYVGIIYCTSSDFYSGRETEKIADCEVIEVAHAVQAVLIDMGYQAELVELNPFNISDLRRFDWIFNLAETITGFPLADYEVARQMEKENIHFTGSGSISLKSCLDKVTTKRRLLRNRINTPAFEVFPPGLPVLNMLEYPLIVKPSLEDACVGISNDSIVHNALELEAQVRNIHQLYKQPALVEQFIDGRDITASIIGNGTSPIALPLSEVIHPEQGTPKFLTFNAKWLPESLEYQLNVVRCPCILEPEVEALMKNIALRSFRAMGCRDYARVDFRLRDKLPFVLEVNPNPCINPHDSSFVRSARANGLSYVDMVMKIFCHSTRRNNRIAQSYSSDYLNTSYFPSQ